MKMPRRWALLAGLLLSGCCCVTCRRIEDDASRRWDVGCEIEEISAAFRADPTSARHRYQGRIKVSGTVTQVQSTGMLDGGWLVGLQSSHGIAVSPIVVVYIPMQRGTELAHVGIGRRTFIVGVYSKYSEEAILLIDGMPRPDQFATGHMA